MNLPFTLEEAGSRRIQARNELTVVIGCGIYVVLCYFASGALNVVARHVPLRLVVGGVGHTSVAGTTWLRTYFPSIKNFEFDALLALGKV